MYACARENFNEMRSEMGKPESKVENRFRDGIKSIGGKAYKLISPGNNGMPDRLVCLPTGSVIFVELKSPTGITSKMQDRRIAELRQYGQTVYVLRNLQEVDVFLGKIQEMIDNAV